MRILFTGGSSFTGVWFIRALVAAGHEVTATFTAPGIEAYSGLRRQRIDSLPACVTRHWNAPFGSESMLQLVESRSWDVLCHHGAVVGAGYKAGSFDYASALQVNTHNVSSVLEALQGKGCLRVMLTGSYFEADEGGGAATEAVSPYGLSKTLTWQVFRYHCHAQGVVLGKFVIPNPFGAQEEARLSSYLAKCWLTGVEPTLKTPDYVRDYIPVDLLAASYRHSIEELTALESGARRYRPSGWVESNLAFAQRLAANLGPHFGVACPVRSDVQVDFPEPLVRRNDEPLSVAELGWNEQTFWQGLANFYREQLRAK